jgi:hypothetical protein
VSENAGALAGVVGHSGEVLELALAVPWTSTSGGPAPLRHTAIGVPSADRTVSSVDKARPYVHLARRVNAPAAILAA